MNKKFLSAILFGALMVTSTGTFVSCKDYDDDIDEINGKIDKIETTLSELESKIGDKGVTSVTFDEKTGVLTVVDGTGTKTYTIKTTAPDVDEVTITVDGKDLKVNGKVVGQVGDTVEVKDGELIINGKATGMKVGQYAILTDNSNGVVTITLPDANGTLQTIKLPTALAAITGIEIMKTSDYTLPWGKATSANSNWAGPKGAIAKDQLLVGTPSSLVVRVTPASYDLSAAAIKLIASDGETEAPATISATPYEGIITKAASANGLWVLDIEPNSTVTASNIAKAFQYKGSDIAYAVQVDGNILTSYDTKVAPTAAVTNKEVNALYTNGALVTTASGFSNPPAVVTVPYGKEVTFSVDNMESEEITPSTTPKTYKIKEQTEVAYDAYLTTSTPTTLANKGITINGKTMTISSTAAAAGAKNISLTVNYVKFDGTTAATVDFTVNFEGTEVDPETPVSEVTYKAMDTPGKIIIDLGTALTGMSTADAAKVAAARMKWTVADDKAAKFIYASPTVKYYKDLKADGTDGKTEVTPTAENIKTVKYAVIQNGSYQTTAEAGSYTLNLTLTDVDGNEFKKVAAPVKVTLPAFDELLSKSKAFTDNVLTALLSGTGSNVKKYNMTNAYNKVADDFDWANIKFEPQKAADGTALATCTTGATPTLEATGVIADNKVKQNVTVKGNYFIGGTANTKLKVEIPSFEVKFVSPFADAAFLFYKENAVVTPIAVTLADDGKNANTGTYTIAKRTGAGTSANKYNGLSLKASNSEKEFNSSIDLFGTTSASYTFKVKDAGNGKAAIDATNGLKLEDMPMGVGVYETTIEVTITDLNGIKTVVNIPIKVQ